VTYQLGFILLLIMGVIGMCVSIMWILHVILYMLPVYPISNLLNEMFIKLDSVFALFGVGAFAAFCGYLMGEYCKRQV
jgi:LMBR1 domain-containing protein 1